MGSGIHGGFGQTKGSKSFEPSKPENGIDYNRAHSKNVKEVDSVIHRTDQKVPMYSSPNSVIQKPSKDGSLMTERYFDKNGKAYLDIDYTDHGNSKKHPIVPHEHKIRIDEDGKIHRS